MLKTLESDSKGWRVMKQKASSIIWLQQIKTQKRSNVLTLLVSQFKVRLFWSFFRHRLSFFLHDPVDALIISFNHSYKRFTRFWQERGASNAVEKLLSIVQLKQLCCVTGIYWNSGRRNCTGDMVILNAGILFLVTVNWKFKGLFIDESMRLVKRFQWKKQQQFAGRDSAKSAYKFSLDGNTCSKR